MSGSIIGISCSQELKHAMPYMALSGVVALSGIVIAAASASTMGIVAGIALAFFGVYALFGIIQCYRTSRDIQAFDANMATVVSKAALEALQQVAIFVLYALFNAILRR
jgi:hypothetical protein